VSMVWYAPAIYAPIMKPWLGALLHYIASLLLLPLLKAESAPWWVPGAPRGARHGGRGGARGGRVSAGQLARLRGKLASSPSRSQVC
jgi:hypothetical protein